MEPDKKRIGRRIRTIRNKAGLTQEEFGERINLSKNHISDIERGVSLPTVRGLLSIYSCFGNTPDEILLGKRTPEVDEVTKKLGHLTPVGLRILRKQIENLLQEGL